MYDSHKFWQDLRLAGGYFDYLDDEDAENQLDAERLKNREEKIKQEEQTEKKTDELIKTERDALLGVSEKLPNEEIIEFIKKNVQDTIEALELVYMFENQKPWYIWPFFSNWNRLSLLLAFYQEEKKFSLTSASFYERLTVYLVKEYSNAGLNCDVSSLVEMFSEFAFDMMENGQTIFSEQGIQNHPTFKHKLETGQIDLLTLLSFPFLVQRGKWYEFRTLAFQVYLSLRKFLQLNEKEKIASYAEFLDLNDCFIDNEHDIWILCSELDLHSFNQYYLIPILKEYLSAVSAKLKGQEADGIA
ncbi:hypothetical protein EDC14_10782 [Hydrogenispora ethanolica]|uniref:Uncharacterized protein n=1 Tax=Hydrogenispora ethanolica TaxID=1082276 RepID=A0A4R1QJ08_HYDET|nr:hypothetical protein EDC14_10782 [Hydrogenispora ethanolica]